jgi:hypothetical protein
MPRGKTQILAGISSFQSIERAVIMVSLGPWYTTRVQAEALGNDIKTTSNAKLAILNFNKLIVINK